MRAQPVAKASPCSNRGWTGPPMSDADIAQLLTLRSGTPGTRLQGRATSRRQRDHDLSEPRKFRTDAKERQLKQVARQEQLQPDGLDHSQQKQETGMNTKRGANSDHPSASNDLSTLLVGHSLTLRGKLGHFARVCATCHISPTDVDSSNESPRDNCTQRPKKSQRSARDRVSKSGSASARASSYKRDNPTRYSSPPGAYTNDLSNTYRPASASASMSSRNALPVQIARTNGNTNDVAGIDSVNASVPTTQHRRPLGPQESLMPRKELLRQRQKTLLNKTNVVFYRQQLQRQFDMIREAVEFPFSDVTSMKKAPKTNFSASLTATELRQR